MLFPQHPTIHDPKTKSCSMGSSKAAGASSSAILFPRLKTQTPPGAPDPEPPHAAKTLSFQAHVAVISSGVCGRLKNTKCRPRRKSYVWRHRPTEVVIWKVVFPSGIELKGTMVGETSPRVFSLVSHTPGPVQAANSYLNVLGMEKIFSTRTVAAAGHSFPLRLFVALREAIRRHHHQWPKAFRNPRWNSRS